MHVGELCPLSMLKPWTSWPYHAQAHHARRLAAWRHRPHHPLHSRLHTARDRARGDGVPRRRRGRQHAAAGRRMQPAADPPRRRPRLWRSPACAPLTLEQLEVRATPEGFQASARSSPLLYLPEVRLEHIAPVFPLCLPYNSLHVDDWMLDVTQGEHVS